MWVARDITEELHARQALRESEVQYRLLFDRNPWSLELYRLTGNEMFLIGTSTLEEPTILTTEVVPLCWQLINGPDRPIIEAVRLDSSQRWQA